MNELWLKPYEFHIIQRLFFIGYIWSVEEIAADLAEWAENDPRLNRNLVRKELEGYPRYRRFEMLTSEFISTALDPKNAAFRADLHHDRRELEVARRLGKERLVWEYEGPYGCGTRYFSINNFSSRIKGLTEFRFAGLRAGSKYHRGIVEEYAWILQMKDCFVSVDRGALESELPDITVWCPLSMLRWRRAGCVEVEIDAYRKSDEAILHNFRKNRGVRFVVIDEGDLKHITQVLERNNARCIIVHDHPADFTSMRDVAEVEVVSISPFLDYLRSLGGKMFPDEAVRMRGLYPRIYSAVEIERMKKREEERRRKAEWERAWDLAEKGDRNLLNQLRWEEIKTGPRAKLLRE